MVLRRTVLAVFMLVFLAGCASWRSQKETVRQCSDTPQNAVLIFLRGMAEFSLAIIKLVIPEGISAYSVFGEGDYKRGQEIVAELVKHPEVADAEAGCSCSFKAMADTDDPDIKLVTVLRKAAVDDGESNRLYERTFLVRFEPEGNCIIAVQPQGQGWVRVN